ncbi:aminopeptidase P family protein [Paenibacillus sp. SYP-B3998]|uniref:Aminopeptidase P family protein n=1 Tax=Paenibacillus sp. SYP-B3998 TaxID=2678564 RepID=A0A6G4A444_9BACL|nr:Xaa-Pro peptidase family protein [Paenibacillus sp. SYP-B3998]NEW09058.1 aminopeptidase P family protein [Paenibacillus sp. SYP-B3998]
MDTRIKRLYAFMEERSLDAMMITQPKLIYYFTGFYTEPHERFLALVLPKGEEPFLFVPMLDLEKAEMASNCKKIYSFKDSEDPFEVLKSKLPSVIRRVGLQEGYVNVKRYHALMKAIGAEQSVDLEEQLTEMRVIKSAEEIVTIKRAIVCIENALHATLPKVKVGVTEFEIVAELEYQTKLLGADGPSFDTLVLSGEKTAMPHGVSGTRKIKKGELLLIDAGVFVDGYASDLTRTFAVGDVDEKLKVMYETVLQANLQMIQAARPGVTYASLDLAARNFIAKKGYGEYFITRAGHGFGLEIHEYPSIHENNYDLLPEGSVFTAEPGIYMPGIGGVRIEDDVLVTKDGTEVLTSFPKELTIIGS